MEQPRAENPFVDSYGIDLRKPLYHQVAALGEDYFTWVHDPVRKSTDDKNCAAIMAPGTRVRSRGKKRRSVSIFRFPCSAWMMFDVNTGTTISATAVGKSKTVANSGTATRGRPMPRVPLTVPAAKKVKRPRARVNPPRSRNGTLVLSLSRALFGNGRNAGWHQPLVVMDD